MRSRWLPTLLVLALPACAGVGREAPSGIEALAGQELLLGSSTGVVSLNAGSGAVTFQGEGVPAMGTWSSVFSTEHHRGHSLLETRDASSGKVVSSVQVPGELSVRIASADGSLVALMSPLPEGASPWVPEPRATTSITVADPTGATEPRAFELEGNFEPEAFSSDGADLYMISFVPPTAPEAYRVARLTLATGRLRDVATGLKPPVVETMAGTRLEQVADPYGAMLHTLYSTEPAPYADHPHHADATVSFVHMLSLVAGWAHCVALPKQMWGGDPDDQAMAHAPHEDRLYVVDTALGLVTEVDTAHPGVLRTVEIDFGARGSAPTQASVSPDGTLYVSTGRQIVAIDTATLERSRMWTMEADVQGLGSDEGHVYVATPGEVRIIDHAGGGELGSITVPQLPDVAYVGLAEGDAA
jgi:hypothetical protein